jgi:hypothetical protein
MRITPPLDLVASPVATILLAIGAVLLPFGVARRQHACRRVESALP